MATYQEYTRNALVELGVLDEHQAPSAIQVNDGIRLLNRMLREWDEAGSINIGYFPGTLPSDDVNVPDWAERAVELDFAVQLASFYHITLTEEFKSNQASAHTRLMAKTIGDETVGLGELPRGQTKNRVGGDAQGKF